MVWKLFMCVCVCVLNSVNKTDLWDWPLGSLLCFEFFFQDLHGCLLSSHSRVQLCVTPWTAARQAPLSMGFSRKESQDGLHALCHGIFPTRDRTLVAALQADFLPLSHLGSPFPGPKRGHYLRTGVFSLYLRRSVWWTKCPSAHVFPILLPNAATRRQHFFTRHTDFPL